MQSYYNINTNQSEIPYNPPSFSSEISRPTNKIIRPFQDWFSNEYYEDDNKQHRYKDKFNNEVPYVRLDGMDNYQKAKFWVGLATIVIVALVSIINFTIWFDKASDTFLLEKIHPKLFALDVVLGILGGCMILYGSAMLWFRI